MLRGNLLEIYVYTPVLSNMQSISFQAYSMKVDRCPTEALSLTNNIILSKQDFENLHRPRYATEYYICMSGACPGIRKGRGPNSESFFFFAFQFFRGCLAQKIAEKMIFSTENVAEYR